MHAITPIRPTLSPDESSPDFANPCFLGSKGENAEIFERLLVEYLRDHVYWRRNFHPEDPLSVPVLAAQDPTYIEFMGRMRTELHALTAALKKSVPFFNPRYMGHMVSDSMLPGLLAQIVTTLYNPNNVSEEAAPVTLKMELEVGEQLAKMLGFATNIEDQPCAWGHLTSGGTLANFEALVNLRSARCFPLAIRDAMRETSCKPPLLVGTTTSLGSLTDSELFNLPLPVVMSLPAQLKSWVSEASGGAPEHAFLRALALARIEAVGPALFAERHPLCRHMTIIAPMTAHYSWRKAAKVLGFGYSQIMPVAVDGHMRMSTSDLKRQLEEALDSGTPILGVVAVLGTTEFGTIDPIHEIVALREEFRRNDLEFAIHVDAAWGGYLASIFRNPDGSLAPHAAVRREFQYFPTKTVYDSFAALPAADSVTVDPHKLGYLPYGVGGIVWRDRRITDFLEEKAEYLFDSEGPSSSDSIRSHYGELILEGSKPGAAAAAAWVSHRVLPLDRNHFGRLQRQTIRATEYFFDRLLELKRRLVGVTHLAVPFEPDTNLVCIAINPAGNRALAQMNAFGKSLYAHLCVDPSKPVQSRDFFSSRTAVRRNMIGSDDLDRVLLELDIDPASFVENVQDAATQSDKLFLLRHTLMNPWLLERAQNENYVDRYCAYLESLIRSEAAKLHPGVSR